MTDETIIYQGYEFRVFRCKENKQNKTWSFYCPYCKKYHYHGIGEGHRSAHCSHDSPLWKTGYYLKLQEAK